MTRVYSRDEVRQIPIRARQALGGVIHGEMKTRTRGFQGLEFADFREYEPGDEVGRIDWNVTARLGKPWVRTYLQERGHAVLMMVDVSSSTHFGSGRTAVRDVIAELAARLGSAAIWNGCDTGLLLFADRVQTYIPGAAGIPQLTKIVRELKRTAADAGETDVAHALDYVQTIRQRRCLIFLLSDFLVGDFAASLQRCAGRHEIVAIGVADSADMRSADCGLLNLRDLETGCIRQVDMTNPHVRSAVDDMMRVRRKHNAEVLQKAGVDHLQLETGKDYLGSLIAFLQRRRG
jgi:uncharacterized protein (DUF58 family)